MSTQAIFVYYSFLLFRVATRVSSLHLELKVPGLNLARYTPFFLFPPGLKCDRLLFHFFVAFILMCCYSL